MRSKDLKMKLIKEFSFGDKFCYNHETGSVEVLDFDNEVLAEVKFPADPLITTIEVVSPGTRIIKGVIHSDPYWLCVPNPGENAGEGIYELPT